MLINTLFLVLRDVLPVFFLCAMLLAMLPTKPGVKIIGVGVVLGSLASVFLVASYDRISRWYEGIGLELMFFVCEGLLLGIFTAFILTYRRTQARISAGLLATMLAVTLILNISNVLTFLLSQPRLGQSIAMGGVIGAGLSGSLAVLLYFFLTGCRRRLPLLLALVPAMFVCGQFAAAFNLLEQVGLVEGHILWSTQPWLPDQSSLAQVLAGLIGYEATPSHWQGISFVVSLIFLSACIVARRKPLAAALANSGVSS